LSRGRIRVAGLPHPAAADGLTEQAGAVDDAQDDDAVVAEAVNDAVRADAHLAQLNALDAHVANDGAPAREFVTPSTAERIRSIRLSAYARDVWLMNPKISSRSWAAAGSQMIRCAMVRAA